MVSFSVANISPGLVRREFMMSVMALVAREKSGVETDVHMDQFYSHLCQLYLDVGRNDCVHWYMTNTESDYLVFLDSDIEVEPEKVFELVRLAEKHHGVYSGTYFNQMREGLRPVAYAEVGVPLEAITWKEACATANDDGVVQVAASGAGFLCIPRECLIKVFDKFFSATPWFAEIMIGNDYNNGTHLGEDLTFCLRAAHVGYPTFLATTLTAKHYKTCVVTEEPNAG